VIPVLSRRQVNRATLGRQLLLERTPMAVGAAVTHLVGLQAQVPLDPYLALWSRLAGFAPDELGRMMLDRQVVRIAVMRSTIHLVTAADALRLRPLVQPVLDGELARHRDYAPALRAVDLQPVLAFARDLVAAQPRTGPQLRAALAERFPGPDPAALAYACRNHLAMVQVPPRGVWGRAGAVRLTTVESWLGRPVERRPSIENVVLRYLAAFGPASVADVSSWSALTGQREVIERLRPQLRTFRDERDRELFDIPDAPHPEADTPAPPRFLPEYDNVLLSHADRTRFVTDEERTRLFAAAGPVHGAVLVDGFVAATWHVERDPDSGRATLVVDPVALLTGEDADAVENEGRRLLALLVPRAVDGDVAVRKPRPTG
jgi:hypothetical protein